jgi:hypothetical protein
MNLKQAFIYEAWMLCILTLSMWIWTMFYVGFWASLVFTGIIALIKPFVLWKWSNKK